MATKKPLVVSSLGQIEEIQSGDTIDSTSLPSSTFDTVLATGNTATDKTAIVDLTTNGAGFKLQSSGTDIVSISKIGLLGRISVTNTTASATSFLGPTNLSLNSVVLIPGNSGTIAVTTDIPATPTLSQVLTAGNNASSSSAIVDDISARLHKITNTTNSNIVSISAPTLAAPRIVTFGDFAGEVTLNNATQTLTNKTINGPDNTIINIAQSSVTNLTTDLASKVTGPASAVDNAVTRFDSTTGKLVQNSNLLLNDEGSLTFTGVASPTYTQGKLVYDTGNEALTFYNNSSNVALQVGQEIYARVVNNTGSTINNGVVVYVNGSSGGLNTIALANANALATSYVLGVTTESITNGSTGHVTTTGVVRGVNTSAYTVGTLLYLSSSSAGGLTNVEPTGANLRVPIARVRVSNISAGEIYVFPTLPSPNSASITAVANGGTGVASLTAYGIVIGGTTSTGPVQSVAVGTAGQVLTSNGVGAAPTFQTAGGGGSVTNRTYRYVSPTINAKATGATLIFTTEASLGAFVITAFKLITVSAVSPAGVVTRNLGWTPSLYNDWAGSNSSSATSSNLGITGRIYDMQVEGSGNYNSKTTVPANTGFYINITTAATGTTLDIVASIEGFYLQN